MNQKTIAGLVAGIALIAGIYLAVVIAPPSQSSAPEYFQQYPQPRELSTFTLTSQDGKPLTNASLKAQWTLVFLGYTYCPDICPTTMASLNQVYPQLQAIEAEYPVKVLFVSVDPNRDSVERMAGYINFFNRDFIGATGPHDQLFPLARSMGMMYAIAGSTDDPNYLVDHSASVVLVNPEGQVVGRFKPNLVPGELPISDGQQILADLPLVIGR